MRTTVFFIAALAMASACSDNPVAVRLDVQDVSVTTPEDTAFVVQVPVDSNRPVQASITTQPSHGVISDLGSSTYSYTPAANYNGPDTVSVTFNNGTTSVVGTVHITVSPVDDAPVANPDSFAAGFSQMLTTPTSVLLANDTDIETDTLTVTEVSAALHGTVTLNGGNVQFSPEPNFQGAASYAYRVSDGMQSSLGNVTVTVGTNNPPVAVNDTVAGTEDTASVVQTTTLLANDTDADHQTLSITNVSAATHGTVAQNGAAITFTPDPNYNGVATYKYTVTDGAAMVDATVTVNIAPVNDPPVVVNDSGFNATEDAAFTFTAAQLLGNDSDVDGDTLHIVSVGNAVNCTVSLPASAVGDTVLLTPTPNFNGTATFTYTVTDGTVMASGNVTVTVGAVPDAPIAVDDTATGAEDTMIAISTASILANDTDADVGDVLSVTAVANPTHGTVTLAGANITFTPALNYNGPASFDYTVSDGTLTDTGTVNVTVTPVNDAPIAVDDIASTPEDVPVGIQVLINDLDVDGDVLSILSTTQGAHGAVTFVGNLATYTPQPNYHGPDSFTYIARDPGGLTSMATVAITVVSVNDAPVAVNDNATTLEDTAITIDVLMNDTDVDLDTLSVSALTVPLHGTATVVPGGVLYTPAANYNGPDSFMYTTSDGNGGLATATVFIAVGPVNDPPVAVDDTYVVNDMAAITAPGVMVNDFDVDSIGLTVTLVDPPSTGLLTLNADGSFTYLPDECSQLETFTYTVSDGQATSNIATVTLTINHTPVANTAFYTMQQDTTLTVVSNPPLSYSLLDYVNDPDPQPISIQLATLPMHAQSFTLNTDGSFVYVPEAGFTGEDSFTWTAADQTTVSNIATAYITVNCTPAGSGSGGCFVPAPNDPAMVHLHDAFVAATIQQCCFNPLANAALAPQFGCKFNAVENAKATTGSKQATHSAQ